MKYAAFLKRIYSETKTQVALQLSFLVSRGALRLGRPDSQLLNSIIIVGTPGESKKENPEVVILATPIAGRPAKWENERRVQFIQT